MSLPRVLISSLAVLVLGSACIKLPEIDSVPEDAGITTQPDASTPANLTVNLLAPSEKTFTNGTVSIQVQVVGSTPNKVELLVDEQPLTSLTPPYTYEWNTASTGEGAHWLRAKVLLADSAFLSEPREVIVDRTPPQVVSRSPAPGAQAVWVQQSIEATFSEPLRRSSVSDASVRLAIGPNALARTASLSNDGQRLTVLPNKVLIAPTAPTLNLSSELTDLAGNSLSTPVETWTWNHPSWVPWGAGTGATIGGGGNENLAALQLDAAGRAIGAWSIWDGNTSKLFIKIWENGAWRPLGNALGIKPNINSIHDFSLILDTLGQPIVAWSEPDGSTTNIHAQRLMNGQWVSLGNKIRAYAGQTRATHPVLQLDPSGAPALAWMESDGTSSYLCLHRWSKDTWQALGECLVTMNEDPNYPLPAFRFDSTGRAFVAWQSLTSNAHRFHVYRLEANEWQDMNPNEESFAGNYPRLSMQVDPSANPITAWPAFDGTADSIYIKRWNGVYWEQLGSFGLNATSGATNALEVTVQVDSFGNPVVAWLEGSGSDLKAHIRRWLDSSWQPVDGFTGPESPIDDPGFGLHRDASGNLLLTWPDRSSPAKLQILRQNR